MGIGLGVTVVTIQINIVLIVHLKDLCRNGTPIRHLTGMRDIGRIDIPGHHPVIFAFFFGSFPWPPSTQRYLIHLQGVARVPLGDRYPSSWESSPREVSVTQKVLSAT